MPCSYWWMICKPSSMRRIGSVGISSGPAGRLVNVWELKDGVGVPQNSFSTGFDIRGCQSGG